MERLDRLVGMPRADVLAELIEHLPIGVMIGRRGDGRCLYANAAAIANETTRLKAERTGESLHFETTRQSIVLEEAAYDVVTSHDVTRYRRIEDELTKRAFFDDLTGLPKRDLFERTINNMIEEGCAPFALSFIDIDNFKYVNDYYGHAVGDQLLVKITRRIMDCMRPTDMLARVGGDEFVLLTTPIDKLDDITPEIAHLSARFRDPFFIDGFEVFTSASIGVSVYPVHGRDYVVLRGNADSAMYQVKGSTKGGVWLFDAKLGHDATERIGMEQRVRVAIRDRRICCAFQPKVDFRTDRIVGAEVLLRWQDENGDIRAPGEIVRLAIELGLMDDIAFIVLDQVIGQIDLFNDAFGREASISLNVAAKQATDVAFMTKYIEALKATGYPERFTLELTEEAFLSKGAFQSQILPMIRAIGAKVSIDDFGVGYSSLSALAEITADELKVDRSFITAIHQKTRNQHILKVIELLGGALNMRIVVEGVETYEELTYLMAATRINCAQGYYFAKPMLLQPPAAGPRTSAEGRGSMSQREAAPGRVRYGR